MVCARMNFVCALDFPYAVQRQGVDDFPPLLAGHSIRLPHVMEVPRGSAVCLFGDRREEIVIRQFFGARLQAVHTGFKCKR